MTVNFSDSSYNGTVTKRDWDLGGQLIANGAKDQGKNFTTAGDYAIKLTVTFSNGDVKTKIDTIHVYPLPVADLVVMNASDTAGCVSHNVQFKSLSTTAVGTIKNYTWDFGGGGTSGTNPTPLFTYKDPGKYTVSLIVENSFGCKSNAATKNNYIKVYPAVVPSFTINGNFSCDTFLLSSFINTTTGGTGLNYKWYFGDGDSTEVVTTDTLKHLYKKPGAYTVTLVVTSASNCKGTYTTPLNNRVFVGKPKPAITCKDTVCSYASMEYTGTSDPAASAYRWIFSDRNTVINARYTNYTFKTSGTYEVILIAYNAGGCSDTVKKTVFVKDAPAAEFTMDQKIGCALPFPVQFTYPGNGNYNYKWDFGDQTPPVTVQSPTHTYTSQGYYSVTFTVTDPATGCSNSLLKSSVIAIAIPTVDFVYTPSSGCKPLKVTTTAQVTNLLPPLTITKYSWDFGDGSKLDTTVTSVSHTYTSNGNFFIRLVIVSSTGCVDTSLSKQVIVSDLCDDDGSTDGGGGQSGFVIGKSCQDKYMVKFVDTVKNSRTIKWDFGDNTVVSTGNLNPITHTYQPPQKIYTVTITRTDTVTNVTSSSQKRIVIIDEKANFSADMTNACQGMQVNFKTIGIDSSRIKKYYWDYGDQTKITLDNAAYYLQSGKYMNGDASHVYLENGVFPVKLIIEDKLGCLDSMIYPVPIRIKGPVAGFIATPLIGCGKELEVTFNDTSLRNGSIPIVKRIWDFGDGSPIDTIASTDTTVKHVYAGNRVFTTYTVKLKVIDSIGCVSEEIRIDHIKRYYPQVNMYSNDTLLCGRLDVKLFNSSNAYNATYLWSFGDSTTSNTYNATHSYTKTGIYTIKLVVTDQGGCKDSITRLSYIKLVKPKADFIIGDTSQCAPVTITFRDTSSYATSYQWFFGDADGGTNKNPAPHIYGEPGNYKVKLAIVGVSGCVDTITKIIHINGPIGKLNVGPTPGCVPYTFHMGVDGSNIKTFAWDFGDGTPVLPMVDSSINHVYLQAGKYLPNAILTSPEGCVVTLKTKDSVIVDELHSNFTILPYAHCDSASVQFVDLSTVSIFSSIVKTEWLFGDDSTAIGPLTGPHNYKYPGVYTVSLITTSAYGCKDTLTKTDSIQVRQSPQVMMTGDSIICLTPGSVLNYQSFTASQDSISLYTWAIDDAAVSSDRYLNYDYRKGGVHDLKFIATTIYGCSASIKKTIFIDSIKANIGINSLSFCSSGTVELKNQTTSVSAVKEATWNLGNGTLLNGMDTSYTFTKPGSYLIKLIATNSNNCRDVEQTTKAIDVFPLPKASIVGDTLLCLPGDATYTSKVISTDSITQFVWNLDDTKIDSLKVFQSFFRQGDHDLKLAVRSATGCVDTVTKHIVVDLLKADFGVLTPILCDKADSARFINLTVGGAYNLSYEWLFGDGTNLITTTTTTPHAYLKPPGIYDVL
ncbi:MAG TPA: PKD domain-containing protein, partial [Bacteroidia bacterium]|nr:PKD domain-containing protein [Bacteroidia bacterium]